MRSQGRRRSLSTSKTYESADKDPLWGSSPRVGVYSFAICSRDGLSGRPSSSHPGIPDGNELAPEAVFSRLFYFAEEHSPFEAAQAVDDEDAVEMVEFVTYCLGE